MRDGKGYLLPDNPQPEGLLCLKIWIPDDPTGYYLAAMSGAFSDMSRWTQWEKDGTNRASLAAQTWKDAVDYTYENGWLNCGMDCCEDINDRLDSIELLLKGLTDMNINVNCGCGCGCGCKDSNPWLDENGQPLPIEPPPIPNQNEPPEDVSVWKCDASHQLADDLVNFYSELRTAATLGELSLPIIAGILAALTLITAGTVWILATIAFIFGASAGTIASFVANWLSEKREDLICVFYSSLTPAQAHDNFLAYLSEHKADVDGQTAGFWVEGVLKIVSGNIAWNELFEPDSIEIHPSNIGSTCPCEGSLIFDIFGDGTWYLVPSLEGEEFVNNNAGYVVGNYLWSFSGSGENQEAQSYPDFPEFLATGKTWLGGGGGQVATTGDHAGYVMQRVGAATGVNTSSFLGAGIIALDAAGYAADDVWTQWQTASDLPKLDFQSGLEAIFDGLSLVHEADRTFSNLDQHRMTMVGVDSSAHATQFRLFAVIAGTALDLS
jgi:hypothetical protein